MTGYLEYQERRVAECEFELNFSEHVEYRSTRKVEYKFVLSGYAEYRNSLVQTLFQWIRGVLEY